MPIAPQADVADDAVIGADTAIWDLAHVRGGATIGAHCVIGRGAYIGKGVRVGDRCKVQNYALIYEPAQLDDGVFIGPAAVLTNDRYPRAITPDGALKTVDDWDAVGVTIRTGASIGARAVCVAPVTIGAWAVVAAGAVVTTDVADFALVAGVPARRIAWVGRAGVPLEALNGTDGTDRVKGTGSSNTDGTESTDNTNTDNTNGITGTDGINSTDGMRLRCPRTGTMYTERDGVLAEDSVIQEHRHTKDRDGQTPLS